MTGLNIYYFPFFYKWGGWMVAGNEAVMKSRKPRAAVRKKGGVAEDTKVKVERKTVSSLNSRFAS